VENDRAKKSENVRLLYIQKFKILKVIKNLGELKDISSIMPTIKDKCPALA
jgi:hypothetical protein